MNLRGVCFAERSSKDGEILGVDKDLATLDSARASNDAVGMRPGSVGLQAVGRPMPAVHFDLDERTLVKQEPESLPGRALAERVLPLDGLVAAREYLALQGFSLLSKLPHRQLDRSLHRSRCVHEHLRGRARFGDDRIFVS